MFVVQTYQKWISVGSVPTYYAAVCLTLDFFALKIGAPITSALRNIPLILVSARPLVFELGART